MTCIHATQELLSDQELPEFLANKLESLLPLIFGLESLYFLGSTNFLNLHRGFPILTLLLGIINCLLFES